MSRLVGGGDDLDDDFVPDDLVALSEDEEGHSADGEDVNALLSADEDTAGPVDAETVQAEAAAVEKKRKRKAKEKERKAKVRTYSHAPQCSS